MNEVKLVISQSGMAQFYRFPMSYYLERIVKAPRKTDLPRLLGSEVHRSIKNLYRYHKDTNNVFYFSSWEKARSSWFRSWNVALANNADLLPGRDPKKEQEWGVTGWVCIYNYWKANVNKPKPVWLEKNLIFPVQTGVYFIGIFDQLRQATPESIANIAKKYRPGLPEAIESGEIDPVYIVDLKTGKRGYDLTRFNQQATLEEQAAYQYELHGDRQVNAYYWLYWKHTGRLPAGFFLYTLRGGEYYYTSRTVESFPGFLGEIEHVVNSINAGEFPRVVGSNCQYCDYRDPCSQVSNQPLVVTSPQREMEDVTFQPVEPDTQVKRSKQLRFKLRVERAPKGAGKQEVKKPPKRVILLPHEVEL